MGPDLVRGVALPNHGGVVCCAACVCRLGTTHTDFRSRSRAATPPSCVGQVDIDHHGPIALAQAAHSLRGDSKAPAMGGDSKAPAMALLRLSAGIGVPGCDGYRKYDSVSKSHLPHLGRSNDPALDIVQQLQEWIMDAMDGAGGGPDMSEGSLVAPSCGMPLPALVLEDQQVSGGDTGTTFDPCSRQMDSAAVRDALAAVGGDPARLAGVSCRKGGI